MFNFTNFLPLLRDCYQSVLKIRGFRIIANLILPLWLLLSINLNLILIGQYLIVIIWISISLRCISLARNFVLLTLGIKSIFMIVLWHWIEFLRKLRVILFMKSKLFLLLRVKDLIILSIFILFSYRFLIPSSINHSIVVRIKSVVISTRLADYCRLIQVRKILCFFLSLFS